MIEHGAVAGRGGAIPTGSPSSRLEVPQPCVRSRRSAQPSRATWRASSRSAWPRAREAAVGPQLCTDDADRLRDQLGALLAVPGGTRAAWRSLDDEAVGPAARPRGRPRPVHRRRRASTSRPSTSLPDARRRGLGHALLVGAADRGRARPAPTEVYASPLPGRPRDAAVPRPAGLRAGGRAPRGDHRGAAAPARARAGRAGGARRPAPRASRTSSPAAGRPAPRGSPSTSRRRRAGSGADQARASISMQVSRAVQTRPAARRPRPRPRRSPAVRRGAAPSRSR